MFNTIMIDRHSNCSLISLLHAGARCFLAYNSRLLLVLKNIVCTCPLCNSVFCGKNCKKMPDADSSKLMHVSSVKRSNF